MSEVGPKMATKPPKLTFEVSADKKEAVELWLDQFNDWCILQGWRDVEKAPDDREHWKEANHAQEISAFRLALPPDVWRTVKSSVMPMMADTADETTTETFRGFPWVWQTFLLRHYSGHDTILAERMTFLETCKQQEGELIVDFEAHCKFHGRRCEYSKMKNAEEELIRDACLHTSKQCFVYA